MGNIQKKKEIRLARRIAGYENAIRINKQGAYAYKKPGSYNK